MSVGLLIVSHDRIGGSLLQTASETIGEMPLRVETLDATRGCDPEKVLGKARQFISQLDDGDGVLVLTDLFGSTPSNIASKLRGEGKIRIVCGLNLPMLIRILNYPDLALDDLTEKAVEGGHKGIFRVSDGEIV